FTALIDDWIRQNPLYRRGYWKENWNSYSLSIRCVVWMQQYALREENLDLEFKSRMITSLYRQIRFLNRNLEYDLRGNHLIKNCRALIWAGRFFAGKQGDDWKRRGWGILLGELGEQILSDGVHYERSPSYHLQVFADLLECYQVIEPGPEREELKKILERMAAAAVDLVHPDGLVSLFNDGGLHMTYRPEELWQVYNRLLGPLPHPRRHIEFPAAGYFGFRRGRDYLLVDCGKIGPDFLPAHGHGDILAFEWDLGGRRIFVDAGVLEYHPGPARAYSRSTRAHNTLTIDDRDQCEFWKSFRVGRRARPRLLLQSLNNGRFILEGSHDGYRNLAGSPIHYRRIEFAEGCLKIKDWVVGGAGQEIRTRFLVHPDNDVTIQDGVCRIEAGTVKLEMKTESRIEIARNWYMPDFGCRLNARQITVSYGKAPGGGEVCFVVSQNGQTGCG
ncbi:MAG: alginate lyase family protein, partial [Candidatus Erginobacter occultus]|nr:alginate lyase family protein [Candidatus Erginobacter occultus]